VNKEELDELALESTRTIEIDEFVEREEIDPRVPDPTLLPAARRQGRP
jgi:non-homologous end joining protein Ku